MVTAAADGAIKVWSASLAPASGARKISPGHGIRGTAEPSVSVDAHLGLPGAFRARGTPAPRVVSIANAGRADAVPARAVTPGTISSPFVKDGAEDGADSTSAL